MDDVTTGKPGEGRPTSIQSRVLIVDDDPEMREAVMVVLSEAGHACEVATDATAALAMVERQPFDVVVSDIRMDGMSGLELLDRVRRSCPALPFIAITGAGGVQQAVDAIKRGAFDYLVKPCDAGQIRSTVARALEGKGPGRESPSRPQVPAAVESSGLVGAGPAMQELQATIGFVSRSNAPVLVMGETGVGKELVARAIHARSSRSSHPFVAVNMSAIPQELLEAELFGHIRGGFTGATNVRKGLFTEADGGTLMLDEIGDMSIGLQAKLLRVLQSGDIRPVGSDRTHHVDVRVISATHRDLPALVADGRFREDLYYRLNVLPVFVPPLHAHREDIPALAAHFLAEARKRAPSSPVCSIGPEALRLLSDAPWPGNVRELASAIERAVVFGSDETIDPRHLPSVRRAAPSLGESGAPAHAWPFPSGAPWTLRHLSRTYAEWVLAETGGNKERAAKILGIDLSTLYRWLRREQPSDPQGTAPANGAGASPSKLERRDSEPNRGLDLAS
jgi:two-component system response regulator HydG